MKNKAIAPELSRPLNVDKIPSKGIVETIVASPTERKKLAERFGLLDLPSLTATVNVGPLNPVTGVKVDGSLQADVVQQCIVTLEPLPAHIEQSFEVQFAFAAPDEDADVTSLLTDKQEDIEPIIGGMIDLGEVVAQYMGASLDPYPRKQGVAFVNKEYGEAPETASPFAKLAQLPKKPNN